MSINLQLPESVLIKPCITVFGVGGAGCNAVNNMINANLEGAKFIVANTDSQALHLSNAEHKIQLGANITKGLGAGASPDIGKSSAEEAIEDIEKLLEESNMVFITAGMGGGTGTGAAPVIARLAREKGILTVGVVTKPFHFEGVHRMKLAEAGLNELQRFVDTLIVIPNQNLFKIANSKTTFADAFKMADDVLHAGVRGITDLMIMPGLINLDFADIRAVMGEMGKAMMGTGEAQGENRAIVAAEAAISNPLLDNCSMKGAKGVLINITGGYDMTLFEVDEAANRIREEVDQEANIIFGSAFNSDLDGTIRVSVVATGIDNPQQNSINSKITQQQAPVQPSTIQQMQQLYKPEKPATASSIFQMQSSDSKEETQHQGFFFTPKAIDPTENDLDITEESKDIHIEEKINTHFLKPAPQPKAPLNDPTPKGSTFSLFGRMANSLMRKNEDKHVEEEEEYSLFKLSEENLSSEDDLVNDEMLNVPAYQRRKQ
ncbi:MAG: cell division protein FtsZ [Pseudomonadota bacterium]